MASLIGKLGITVVALGLTGCLQQNQLAADADPIEALNQLAREEYRKARSQLLAAQDPVIYVSGGDSVILIRQGVHETREVIPREYHQLKGLSHISLGLFGLAASGEEGWEQRMRAFREAVTQAQVVLPTSGLSAEQIERNENLAKQTLARLDAWLEAGSVSQEEVVAFVKSTLPAIRANRYEAAKAHLQGLHEVLHPWYQSLSEEEKEEVKVVISGPSLPRRDYLPTQYVARLLGVSGEGARIVYAENLWTEEQAMGLLGTHLLDTQLGGAIFDDPQRMHRDLLGDDARQILQEMTF